MEALSGLKSTWIHPTNTAKHKQMALELGVVIKIVTKLGIGVSYE